MTLAVVGAGFGRTGTNSIKLALATLGLGPCHHMTVLLDDPAKMALWERFAHGAPMDWNVAFAGFRSAVDWPSATYWQKIAAHYPKAKVLLTIRSAESWWDSYSKTIVTHLARQKGTGSWGDVVLAGQVMHGQPNDRATCIAAYNANNDAVRALVPADRLIIHEVGDGWEPLCSGLDLPVPAEDYPKTNSSAEFLARHAARNSALEGKS